MVQFCFFLWTTVSDELRQVERAGQEKTFGVGTSLRSLSFCDTDLLLVTEDARKKLTCLLCTVRETRFILS